MGNNPTTLFSSYIVGSGVGSQNKSVRRALIRRASNNTQGNPCCIVPGNSAALKYTVTRNF